VSVLDSKRPPGRPRDGRLDAAILAAAERQLRERGYGGMSLESVAAAAGTTVPALRRRYSGKASLAQAVVDSLRIEALAADTGASPRDRALAVLENMRHNLEREHSMALLGTLLAEESRHPELLERFRTRLVTTRRERLADAVRSGVAAGELAPDADVDMLVSMLIGSFYARYISHGQLPRSWPQRALFQVWPPPRTG
jgi:AcrR family transcriptional regulator